MPIVVETDAPSLDHFTKVLIESHPCYLLQPEQPRGRQCAACTLGGHSALSSSAPPSDTEHSNESDMPRR